MGKPIRMWITLMVFLWLTVGQALALVEGGPVSVQVDKAQGKPGTVLEAPWKGGDLPHAELRARPVEQPTTEAKVEKKPAWWYVAADWVVDAFTGVSLEDWGKPQRLWYNIGNAVLELLTGTGIEKYQNWRNWGVGDYLWTIGNIALTIFTFGGGSILKSLGIKVLGPVGRFAANIVKVAGKSRLVKPVARFFTVGRGGAVKRTAFIVSDWFASSGRVQKMRQFASKALQWARNKGFSGVAKYTDPNPLKNQLVKDISGWIAKSPFGQRIRQRVADSFLGRAMTAVNAFSAKGLKRGRKWFRKSLLGEYVADTGSRLSRKKIGRFRVDQIVKKSELGWKDVLKAAVKRDPVSLVTDGLPKVLTAFKSRLKGNARKWARRTINFAKRREEADGAKKLWERGSAAVAAVSSLFSRTKQVPVQEPCVLETESQANSPLPVWPMPTGKRPDALTPRWPEAPKRRGSGRTQRTR